jgi:eukaryotic-like serine/threonine-protein kinase
MGRTIAGRYQLGTEIGVGGTSRVYRGVDERLGRDVAVKLLDERAAAAVDPAMRQRFVSEAKTGAMFLHPNAVTVFDAGEDDGDLYMVMELVEGPNLATHLAARQDLISLEDGVAIADQVLAALEAAHDQGIVHRDVKPANVLMGPDGDVKLADFGIAKRFDDLEASLTATGMVVGTPRYLAPEQARGLAAGPPTDVYAMGILLFEMLTGRLPFEADTPVAVAARAADAVPDVRSLRPDVPDGVAAAILRALATNPADRFADAAELRLALAGRRDRVEPAATAWSPTIGGATTVVARQADATSVMAVPADVDGRPDVRRNRHLRVGLAVAAVLLVAGVAYSLTGDDLPDPRSEELALAAVAAETTDPPVVEIIPGFPATGDLWVFLEQLERDPLLVGLAGEEIVRGLRRVLEVPEGSREQRAAAVALREGIQTWLADEHLDPAIGDALDALLAPVAERPEPEPRDRGADQRRDRDDDDDD